MTTTASDLADKIIAAYLEHYSFPPQGESHLHDCIMDAVRVSDATTIDEFKDKIAAVASAYLYQACRLGEAMTPRTVPGRSYGAQPEAPARDIAEHVTIRIPQHLVVQLRAVMRRYGFTRTQAVIFLIKRGLDR